MENFVVAEVAVSEVEVSAVKLTNAEKCTTGVFLKWSLFD